MTRTMSYRDALREALELELEADDRVVLLGEDAGSFGGPYGVTSGLLERFGERRVRDAPAAERGLIGLAAGAAIGGLRPVAELMSSAAVPRVLGELLAGAAQLAVASGGALHAPLTLRVPQGGGAQLGPTHQVHVEGLLLQLPGVVVAAPSTPADALLLLRAAIRSDVPAVVVEHVALLETTGEVPDEDELPPAADGGLGRAAVRREGEDVTLVAWSRGTHTALAAADLLERQHRVSAEVVDLRTLRPLDLPTVVRSVERTNRCVVVDDASAHAGAGAILTAAVQEAAFDALDAPVGRVGGAPVPVPYARPLAAAALPDAERVAAGALRVLYRD